MSTSNKFNIERDKEGNRMTTTTSKQGSDLTFKTKPSRVISFRSIVLSVNSVIILVCSAMLIYQCSQCLSRYLEYQTKAILSVQMTGDATFFALTICPRPEEAYNATALNEFGITRDDYWSGYFYGKKNPGNRSRTGFDIFNRVTYNLSAIMSYVKISTADPVNSTINIYFNVPLDPKVATMSTIYDDQLGRCYSLQFTPWVTQKAIINIVLMSKMGVFVYLHHPGQYMSDDSKTKVYGILANMNFIDITHELSDNTLENNKDNPCNSTVDNTFDTCMTTELTRNLTTDFGCVVPYLPKTNTTQVCNFDFSTPQGLAFQQNVMARYNYLAFSGMNDICPPPCASIDFFLGMPFGGVEPPNLAYIKLYIKSTVKSSKTVWDYEWISMLAEVGGYMGLFLGISVVDSTETLRWAMFRFFRR